MGGGGGGDGGRGFLASRQSFLWVVEGERGGKRKECAFIFYRYCGGNRKRSWSMYVKSVDKQRGREINRGRSPCNNIFRIYTEVKLEPRGQWTQC